MTEERRQVEEQSAQEVQEEEHGATMIEYALLVALIAIIALAAIRYLGQNVSRQFSNISTSL